MRREQQIAVFVKRVEQLRRLPLVTKEQGVGWSFTINTTKGLSFGVKLLDENDLRSFLLTFRQFIAPGEDIQLNKVYSTCFRGLKTNNDLKGRLLESREAWKQALNSAGNIKFEEQMYSGEQAAIMWMNGYYFHGDLEKYEQLEKLMARGWPFVQMHFGNFVVDATKVIIHTGHLVAYARKNDLFRF